MRIVIPYVRGGLKPETRAWGEQNGAELHDLTNDDEAYFGLVARLWRDGQAFMVVEQDVVPPEGAPEDLATCPEPWCGHPYPYIPCSLGYSMMVLGELGCTRFTEALLSEIPAAMVDAAAVRLPPPFTSDGGRHWLRLAPRLRVALEGHGVHFHAHPPAAEHVRGRNRGGPPRLPSRDEYLRTRDDYLRNVHLEIKSKMQRLASLRASDSPEYLFALAVIELWGGTPDNYQDLDDLRVLEFPLSTLESFQSAVVSASRKAAIMTVEVPEHGRQWRLSRC